MLSLFKAGFDPPSAVAKPSNCSSSVLRRLGCSELDKCLGDLHANRDSPLKLRLSIFCCFWGVSKGLVDLGLLWFRAFGFGFSDSLCLPLLLMQCRYYLSNSDMLALVGIGVRTRADACVCLRVFANALRTPCTRTAAIPLQLPNPTAPESMEQALLACSTV